MSDNSFKKASLDYNIGSIAFNNIIDPIILFRKVDLPTLGFPIIVTKPDLCIILFYSKL